MRKKLWIRLNRLRVRMVWDRCPPWRINLVSRMCVRLIHGNIEV